MPSTPVIETPPTLALPTTPRCLELRPVLNRLGLSPIVIGVGRVVVGSASNAEAQIAVEGVAATHAEIDFDGRQARIKVHSPLTWLNDGPVREAILRDGDILTLGPVEYRVQSVSVPAPPPPPLVDPQPQAPVVTAQALDPLPLIGRTASTAAVPETGSASTPTKNSSDPLKPRSRVARVQRDWLEKRRNGSLQRERPAVTESVQPLLDEAEAARNLKHDLERVEREAAWYQASLSSQPTVVPQDVHNEAAPAPVIDTSDDRERQLSDQAQQLALQAEELARQQSQLQAEQAELIAVRQQLASERDAVAAQAATLASEREALRSEREPLQATTDQVRQQSVSLQREREQLLGAQQKLSAEREELASREQRLAVQQAEFDSAVVALDLDRDTLLREREATQVELTQTRQRLDSLKSELAAHEQQLVTQQDELHRQVADLESRELAVEERHRDGAARLREREMDLSRRETGWRQRESVLTTQASDIEARRAQSEQAARQIAIDRSQLDADRDELTRSRQDIERQRREVVADRERVRGQSQSLTEQAERAAAEWERLQAAIAELDAERGQLAEQARELARRRAELDAQQKDVANSQRLCAEREIELDRQAKEFTAQCQSLSAPIASVPTNSDAHAGFRGDEQQLDDLRLELEQEQLRLAEWSRELEALQSELEQQAQAVADRPQPDSASGPTANLTDRERELTEQEQALEAAVAELEQHRDDIARQWEELESRAATLAEQESLLATAELTNGDAVGAPVVDELQTAVATLTAERDRLLAELTEFDAVQAEWNAQYDALTQRISELESRETEVLGREQRLSAHAAATSAPAADAELEGLRHMVEALTADRDRLQATLDGVATNARENETTSAIETESGHSLANTFDTRDELESPPSSAREYAASEPDDQPLEAAQSDREFETTRQPEPMSGTADPAGTGGSLLDSLFRRPASPEAGVAARTVHPEHAADAAIAEPTAPPQQARERRTEAAPTASPAQPSSGIRSQLAMLFGISSNELDAAEARHSHDDAAEDDHQAEASAVELERSLAREVRAAAVAPPPLVVPLAPTQTAEPDADDAAEDDSVAAYMQRLLKKSSLGNMPPAASAPAADVAQSQPRQPDVSEVQQSADLTSESEASGSDDDEGAKARAGRRMDKEEIAEMRASIDSMRQIANLSARSAVARHYAKKLDVTYKVKQALTAVAGGLSALLLTAELWTSNSYRMPGICSGIVALIAGIETARTAIQMRRVRQIASMQPGKDADPAAADAEQAADA